jgi:hypothetical protein
MHILKARVLNGRSEIFLANLKKKDEIVESF